MRLVPQAIKPAAGTAHFLHRALVLVLPAAVFALVIANFAPLAAVVVVLSKWRMFAVRPRFWAANIRANSIDLMVGLSLVTFMANSGNLMVQVIWALVYAIWLLAIKPGN